jgi:hypothetical protein
MTLNLTNPPDLTNPKDAYGEVKFPMHLWPSTATAMGSLALMYGANKYGKYNWRETSVKATVYSDALERHMAAWKNGEIFDNESGVPHLSHALACLAILVDAGACYSLIDDRPGKICSTAFASLQNKYEYIVKDLYKSKYDLDISCNSEKEDYSTPH